MTIEERYLQPDWSKAPADAEYYAPMRDDKSFYPVWIKGDLDSEYFICFALKDEDAGPFTDFTTKTPHWSWYNARSSAERTNYYKSALIPRPSSDFENDWVNV